MKTYWIYSRYSQYWYNGIHIITNELVQNKWYLLQEMYYQDTRIVLYRDQFEMPKKPEPEWTPMTSQQLINLLNI